MLRLYTKTIDWNRKYALARNNVICIKTLKMCNNLDFFFTLKLCISISERILPKIIIYRHCQQYK